MSRIDKYTGDGKQISGYEGPGEGDREEWLLGHPLSNEYGVSFWRWRTWSENRYWQ
jgi:hypothetical protein